jgi:hypothetical protein
LWNSLALLGQKVHKGKRGKNLCGCRGRVPNRGQARGLAGWKRTFWLLGEIETSIMKTTKALFGILSITMALAVQVQAQTFLTNGLVAYYPFNGNANDASGNGNNGMNNGVTFGSNRFNSQNSSGYFNGSSWIVVNYNTNLFYQTFTISLWLTFNDLPTDLSAYEIAIGSGGNESWHGFDFTTFNYFSEIGGPPMFGYVDTDGSGWSAQIGKPISSWVTNQWYQLVLVRTTTNAQLFINNNLASVASGLTPIAISTMSPLVIGAGGSFSSGFRGAIDDIRIYNRALSTNEVQQLYVYESGPQLSLIKAVKPSFSNLTLTTNYQLQVSADMSTWTNQGSPFTATNTSMVYPQYWDVDNWGQLFFRLQVAP